MKVLVVDDSRAIRMILSRILAEVGFDEVLEAGDGSEALNKLAEHGAPDLMLVDWNMPVMNGYELVQSARGNDDYAGMPIMMVTTETEMDQVVKALEAGANEYIMKPFNKDDVLSKLEILGLKS